MVSAVSVHPRPVARIQPNRLTAPQRGAAVGAMLVGPIWRRRGDGPFHCCRHACCRCCRAGSRLRIEPICHGGSVSRSVTSAAEQAGASAPVLGRSGVLLNAAPNRAKARSSGLSGVGSWCQYRFKNFLVPSSRPIFGLTRQDAVRAVQQVAEHRRVAGADHAPAPADTPE